jgi:hypothetical protein
MQYLLYFWFYTRILSIMSIRYFTLIFVTWSALNTYSSITNTIKTFTFIIHIIAYKYPGFKQIISNIIHISFSIIKVQFMMSNIHIQSLFSLLLAFPYTNAFIPHPLLANGGQTGDSKFIFTSKLHNLVSFVV